MRFDRPIGILLLLWPTLWALWIAARGFPGWPLFIIFVFGVVIMRAAGCVINDFADRNFDHRVARTQTRPLTTGQVSVTEALCLFSILCLMAFLLVLLLNTLTVELAILAVVMASLYPFMKRYIHLPQVVLGVTFSWGIPMAFAAKMNTVPSIAWLLFLPVVLWCIAYDTEYAMADRADDRNIGIKSTAILFGCYDRCIIGALQGIMVMLLGYIGILLHFSISFYVALFIVVGLMVYQQILMQHREPAKCLRAFLNNHWIGLIIFVGIVLSLL